MRYFFAFLSLVVAIVLLVLGVGQRTFLAGPKTIEELIDTSSLKADYLVVPHSVLESKIGNPAIIVGGEDLFVAQGNNRDIDAWLAPFDHIQSVYDAEEGLIELGLVPAEKLEDPAVDSSDASEEATTNDEETGDEEELEEVFFDPRGSDLWLSESNGETSLTVSLALEDSQSVLITSGIEDHALPTEIKIMWAQARETPLAGPLLLAGGIFVALGIVLYILALDHDRRGLGPRRGRKGPLQGLRNRNPKMRASLIADKNNPKIQTKAKSVKKLSAVVALAASGVLVLTSCSPSYWPQPQAPEETQEIEVLESDVAVVPVSDKQLDEIIERVIEEFTFADTEIDASALSARAGEAALQQREANFKIRKAEEGWRSLPLLTSNRVGYDLIQSTEKWPRTLFVTLESLGEFVDETEEESEAEGTETDSDSEVEEVGTAETADNEPEELTPTLVLILQQESAHDNYLVNRIIELRGGIQMPEAAPVSVGTAVLSDDIQTLLLTPFEAAQNLSDVMQIGEEAEQYELFEFNEEPLVEKMGGSWAETQCVDDLECEATVSVAEDSVITLSTGQSGALVVATINDQHKMKVNTDRSIVKLSKVETALGLDGTYSSVTRHWVHQVLMYVPGQDSDKKISILGSSSELVNATGEKANIDIE